MKKNGFTLSELIVTLSIIGIASALMMPAITKLVPDKNKTKVNNIHAKIVTATSALIDDDAVYWCADDTSDEGLSCEGQPQRTPYNTAEFSDAQKYENLMVQELGLDPADSPVDNFNWSTPDGVDWRFERGWDNNGTFSNVDTGVNNTLCYRITVDLNGAAANKTPNRIYGQNNEQRPDRFRFWVDNYGGVTPDDAMTAAYMRNAFKSADKRNDRAVAQQLLADKARYRAF